jgi:dTDP-4-dehydrorhamnose 3,5-epimerase
MRLESFVSLPIGSAPRADLAPPAPLRAGNATAWGFPGVLGPLLIEVRRFGDARGVFAETFSRRDFAALGIEEEFVQDNWSRSDAVGTVRGLHFQRPPHAQAKIVRVLRGAILDVAVDLRRASATYAQHVAVELEEGDGRMLYVPAGFAHGFCTLRPGTEIAYKVSDVYAPDCDGGVIWDDPDIGIEWPVDPRDVVLSDKDAKLPRLADLPAIFA